MRCAESARARLESSVARSENEGGAGVTGASFVMTAARQPIADALPHSDTVAALTSRHRRPRQSGIELQGRAGIAATSEVYAVNRGG
jgi:hypothetical protein